MKSNIKQKSPILLRSPKDSKRLKLINEIEDQYQLCEQLNSNKFNAQTPKIIQPKQLTYQVKQSFQSKNLQDEVQNFKKCLDIQYKNSLRQLSFDQNEWNVFQTVPGELKRSNTEETGYIKNLIPQKEIEQGQLSQSKEEQNINSPQLSNRICQTEINEDAIELLNQQRQNKFDKQLEIAKKINIFMNRILHPQNIINNKKNDRGNKLAQRFKEIKISIPIKNNTKINEYYPPVEHKLTSLPKLLEGLKNRNKQNIQLIDQDQIFTSRSMGNQPLNEHRTPSIILQEPYDVSLQAFTTTFQKSQNLKKLINRN